MAKHLRDDASLIWRLARPHALQLRPDLVGRDVWHWSSTIATRKSTARAAIQRFVKTCKNICNIMYVRLLGPVFVDHGDNAILFAVVPDVYKPL